jgi:hypothetical protein
MRVTESLATGIDFLGNFRERSIIESDLNLLYAHCNANAECASESGESQAFVNRLLWENGYTRVVYIRTKGDALLDVYLDRAVSLFNCCSIEQGISDHLGYY